MKHENLITHEILKNVTSANELANKAMNEEVIEENLRHLKSFCRNVYAPLISGLGDLIIGESVGSDDAVDTVSSLMIKALDAGDEEQTIWVHNLKKIIEKYSK